MSDDLYSGRSYYPVKTNAWALVSVISGVLAWLGMCGRGGLAAVVCGHIGRRQIRSEPHLYTGEGLATAGLVLGYLNLALSLAGCCLMALIFAGAISMPLFLEPVDQFFQGL